MRGTGSIVFAIVLVAALMMWARSAPHSIAPAVEQASIAPIDIMQKIGKDLRDETPRQPF
jgi:hypothetical protein